MVFAAVSSFAAARGPVVTTETVNLCIIAGGLGVKVSSPDYAVCCIDDSGFFATVRNTKIELFLRTLHSILCRRSIESP